MTLEKIILFDKFFICSFHEHSIKIKNIFKVALKRQQAVEDAIALRLASNETGKSLETLPPGKIFGMKVTEPKIEKPNQELTVIEEIPKKSELNSHQPSPLVSQNAIEMLSSLFPHRKRSVLELVLRRCDLDLLR